MTKRYLVGGPANSGKSTLVLSLTQSLEQAGFSARAIEFDLWSNSYPAFEGLVPFGQRDKRFDLRWEWQEPLIDRLNEFMKDRSAFVFGDMPGKLGEACAFMCRSVQESCDGAIVVSRTLEGIRDWSSFFDDFDIPVIKEVLSVRGTRPLVIADLDRKVDASHSDVLAIGKYLFPE